MFLGNIGQQIYPVLSRSFALPVPRIKTSSLMKATSLAYPQYAHIMKTVLLSRPPRTMNSVRSASSVLAISWFSIILRLVPLKSPMVRSTLVARRTDIVRVIASRIARYIVLFITSTCLVMILATTRFSVVLSSFPRRTKIGTLLAIIDVRVFQVSPERRFMPLRFFLVMVVS